MSKETRSSLRRSSAAAVAIVVAVASLTGCARTVSGTPVVDPLGLGTPRQVSTQTQTAPTPAPTAAPTQATVAGPVFPTTDRPSVTPSFGTAAVVKQPSDLSAIVN